jgi:hypothetical protein
MSDPRQQFQAAINDAARTIGKLLVAAHGGKSELREATSALSATEAEWALACAVDFHRQKLADASTPITVDDATIDDLLATAAFGFGAIAAMVSEMNEPTVKAALANLVALYGDQLEAGATAQFN